MLSPSVADRVSPFEAAPRVGFALFYFSGVRRAAFRALVWTAAAFVILVATPALAASRVPMCGVHAETITAPPIARAAKEVPLSGGACERQALNLLEQRAPKPAPTPLVSLDMIPRLPAIAYRLSPPPRTRNVLESLLGDARPGHSRGIERPPR